MAQIIRFTNKNIHSTGYNNFVRFFETCSSVKTCNFYLDSIEILFQRGDISESEMFALRRIGRQKRLKLAQPAEREPVKAEGSGVYTYTPEMGEGKPACQMEATRAYYGKHWFVDTPVEIRGRGITFLKKYAETDFCDPSDHRVGWNEYQVTKNAFEKLKAQYSISHEVCLD